MHLKILFVTIYIIQSAFCYATAQVPDYIIYEGKRYSLFVNPMNEYFFEFPEKQSFLMEDTTANWKGYVATFEIIENELFVIGITVRGRNITKDCLNGLDKLKTEWFNGLLVLPHGDLIEYIHLGYASLYEHYKLIEIKNGNFIMEYNLNSNQYKKYTAANFDLWLKTEEFVDFNFEQPKEYEEILFELIDESIPDEVIDYLIRKYDILKKMIPQVFSIIPKDIEKEKNIYLVKNHHNIIGGMIGIFMWLIYLIVKKAINRRN